MVVEEGEGHGDKGGDPGDALPQPLAVRIVDSGPLEKPLYNWRQITDSTSSSRLVALVRSEKPLTIEVNKMGRSICAPHFRFP